MAYDADAMVPRLRLYPSGRKQGRALANLPQPGDRVRPLWHVAWSGLHLRGLGTVPRGAADLRARHTGAMEHHAGRDSGPGMDPGYGHDRLGFLSIDEHVAGHVVSWTDVIPGRAS